MIDPQSELVFTNPLVGNKKEHTLSVLTLENGEWVPMNTDKLLSKGKIEIKTKKQPLVIADLRYYNWLLSDVEKEFNASVSITRHPVADREPYGLLVDIDASRFNPGDTAVYIPNNGISGYFEAMDTPAVVESVKGKTAFRFDGNTFYRSGFPLPATVRDNAPYTLDALILNPEIAENECFADFTSSHDELEKIMGVNGTEKRCGVMNHYGWYEDAGWEDVKDLAGEWQHIYVCFDGRIEKVYINGKLVSEKDIQLLVKPSQFITLGRNAENEWPFSGYIGHIRFYDEFIPFSK